MLFACLFAWHALIEVSLWQTLFHVEKQLGLAMKSVVLNALRQVKMFTALSDAQVRACTRLQRPRANRVLLALALSSADDTLRLSMFAGRLHRIIGWWLRLRMRPLLRSLR